VPSTASALRTVGRSVTIGLVAALVIVAAGVAIIGWRAYQNSRPLDVAAIFRSAPVRTADKEVAARIDADAADLTGGATWLTGRISDVSDSCALTSTSPGFFYSRSAQRWQCTRQFAEVFGVSGGIRARSRLLSADLTADGWDTSALRLLVPGIYEQATYQGTGQAEHDNPPSSLNNAAVGSFDLTVFWAKRPAVLRALPPNSPLSAVFTNAVIRRAYQRYSHVVVFAYAGIYVEGTGPDVSAATTPPSNQGRGPCAGGGTDC
jgi:hypothetical protein